MNIQKVIDLFKSKDYNINLSFRMVTKGTKLLKKFALAIGEKPEDLSKLFSENNTAFFGKINSFIADEYNEETDEYGELSKQLFKLLQEITNTKRDIEDIQFVELVELMQDIVAKIQEDSAENFTQAEDMMSANTTKQLSIIETEKSPTKKEKVKI